MKTNKYLFIIILLIITLGCSDYFELERPPQSPWNTVEEFDRAAVGVYGALFQGAGWQNPIAYYYVPKTSMGDDVGWVSAPSHSYWRETKEYEGHVEWVFRFFYVAIAGTNNALQFAAENDYNPYPTATADDIKYNVKRVIGEMYFIRAFAYYHLEMLFGHAYVPGGANDKQDIPLRTEFSSGIEDADNPHMGTTAEVYAQILSDLEKAVELLPEEYIAGKMTESYQVRATKYAAIAMQARTYFQMGDYENAREKCSILINENGGRFDLTEDPIEAFNKSTLDRGREVIFYLPFFDTNYDGPFHITIINHNAGAWGQCNWCETHMAESALKRLEWMSDPQTDTTILFNARADKRFQQLFALRYPESLAKPGQAKDARNEIKDITTVWTNKYYRGSKRFNTNLPLIRLAEIYLIRSACNFKLNDKAAAADDLNAVRKRAWDTNYGGAYVDLTANDVTEQVITDEQLVEMFGEPLRIDFLRGLKTDIPDGDRGTGVLSYDSENLVWAIPISEKLYNHSIDD